MQAKRKEMDGRSRTGVFGRNKQRFEQFDLGRTSRGIRLLGQRIERTCRIQYPLNAQLSGACAGFSLIRER
jgi:hypothetical protein